MRHYIGIDLGGTNIAAGVVREDGTLVKTCSIPTGANRPAEAVVADMVQAAKLCLDAAGMTTTDITAMGVGVPGAVDDATGMTLFAPNLHWNRLPLTQMLRSQIDLPVHLGNDADCAALGEVLAGCASSFDSAVMITLGTGVGGGLVANRHVFTGWAGGGIEPGHMTLVAGGIPCGCGNRGCFEVYASATALIRQTREAMITHRDSKLWDFVETIQDVTAKTPFDAAKVGDAVATAVLEQYEEYLAAGIGGIVNLFRPQAVILGGGVSNQGEVLLAPVREKLLKYCYASEYIAPPQLLKATLGNDAGIIGAALLAL
jgi:glucokinase